MAERRSETPSDLPGDHAPRGKGSVGVIPTDTDEVARDGMDPEDPDAEAMEMEWLLQMESISHLPPYEPI